MLEEFQEDRKHNRIQYNFQEVKDRYFQIEGTECLSTNV